MPLGAIVKAGAKSLAKEKAKSFITGKGKGKGGALKKVGEQKPKVNPSNLMGRQVGGDTGGADIPASKQTINVTALGSDSPVSSGGGGGDIKIVQDISVAVSAIAESMKSGLVLKEKAQQKEAKIAESQKRAAQETELEKPDEKDDKPKGPKFKVPKIGFLEGIFGFITKYLMGALIIKLIDLVQNPAVMGIIKGLGVLGQGLLKLAEFVGVGLISLIDFGYTLVDGAEKIVGKIFGEEGAKKFKTFMENITPLLNAFLVFKILKAKFGKVIIDTIKNAFRAAKNIIKNAGKLVAKLFPNVAKGATKLFQAGKGLVTKGLSKVGGFAAKIFGKASGVIAPAFKGAKPFLSKFFGKIPIVGPLVVTIVSLLSGEPASQAIFKGLGAALGGALGTFIPIPILGTLIGETIGVFVGDLIYELLMGGGIQAVGQKLKDTFMTIFKGGKAVANWLGGGIKAFIKNVLTTDPINVPEGGGVRSLLTRGTKKLGLYGFLEGLGFAGGKDGQIDKFFNPLNLLNPFKFYPLLFKSFFGKRDEGETGGGETAVVKPKEETTEMVVDDAQTTKNGDNADAVAGETTYESGEGEVAYIPVPVVEYKEVPIKNKRGRITGYRKTPTDPDILALYAGK